MTSVICQLNQTIVKGRRDSSFRLLKAFPIPFREYDENFRSLNMTMLKGWCRWNDSSALNEVWGKVENFWFMKKVEREIFSGKGKLREDGMLQNVENYVNNSTLECSTKLSEEIFLSMLSRRVFQGWNRFESMIWTRLSGE